MSLFGGLVPSPAPVFGSGDDDGGVAAGAVVVNDRSSPMLVPFWSHALTRKW
jgi:hypothetical protein